MNVFRKSDLKILFHQPTCSRQNTSQTLSCKLLTSIARTRPTSSRWRFSVASFIPSPFIHIISCSGMANMCAKPVATADDPNHARTQSLYTFSHSPVSRGGKFSRSTDVITTTCIDYAWDELGRIKCGMLGWWVDDRIFGRFEEPPPPPPRASQTASSVAAWSIGEKRVRNGGSC